MHRQWELSIAARWFSSRRAYTQFHRHGQTREDRVLYLHCWPEREGPGCPCSGQRLRKTVVMKALDIFPVRRDAIHPSDTLTQCSISADHTGCDL
jgi:hypothetical protein